MEHKLYETYRKIEAEHWWFVGRQAILANILRKYFPPKAKILDIGCNTGVLVGILQKNGYEAFGSDMSQEAIEYGSQRGVKKLYVATGEKQPFPDQTFDCVMALDVIEHIDDDGAVIKEMKRLLKPDGKIIIKVTAFMFLWGLQDEAAHHKRRYTKNSLSKIITSEGFSIIRETYFNTFLFIPILISRLIQKIMPPKRTSDFDLNNRFINAVLRKIFIAEAFLLRYIDFPFGVSLLAVASKKHEE